MVAVWILLRRLLTNKNDMVKFMLLNLEREEESHYVERESLLTFLVHTF